MKAVHQRYTTGDTSEIYHRRYIEDVPQAIHQRCTAGDTSEMYRIKHPAAARCLFFYETNS